MSTLYLDPDKWDLVVDAYGNIAVADEPYAVAQDVASACRLWMGEGRYDTKRGIPYEQSVLGYLPPASLLAQWYRRESVTIESVVDARVSLNYNVQDRSLTGSIMITTTTGETFDLAI